MGHFQIFYQMETEIFPFAILNTSVEEYDSQIRIRSKVIYLIAVVLFLLALAFLSLIVVDVAEQTRGTFKSSIQKNLIQIATKGRLESWNLSENQKVELSRFLQSYEDSSWIWRWRPCKSGWVWHPVTLLWWIFT